MDSDHVGRTLGARIKARRQELGLTQAQLAERLGLANVVSVSRYEVGERDPRLATLIGIATALDWPVEDLVRGLGAPPPSNQRPSTRTRARPRPIDLDEAVREISDRLTKLRATEPERAESLSGLLLDMLDAAR
jgi:transcriptional regulator with XRE-family HTH domain